MKKYFPNLGMNYKKIGLRKKVKINLHVSIKKHIFVSTNHINKMKTTFTLPQAIALAVTLFIIFGIIVLKFGHTIN